MDLYPLDLVLASALAWSTIFLGGLPTCLIRAPVFTRPVGLAGLGWLVVALLSPTAILHYDIFVGLICLFAWWQLRREEALRGKLWLAVASGLGISLGVVLILAVTPIAYPAGLALWNRILVLASIYLGGAVIGLGGVVYLFTRREPTQTGIPAGLVQRYAQLLFGLTLARAACAFLLAAAPSNEITRDLHGVGWILLWFVLPILSRVALRRARSPAPSTSGAPLLALCLAGLIAEILMRLGVR
jgi:hypothetical protein